MTTTPISGFRNAIINGDFRVWQRGTSFTTTGAGIYTSDRWLTPINQNGAVISRQPFTPGISSTIGYESEFYLRYVKGGTTADLMALTQRMEDVRTFAGQTVTLSYWMKGSQNFTNEPLIQQNFGSGGSGEVYTTTATQNITTSWARYSVTFTVPSISGKTIGANNFLSMWVLRYLGTTNITAEIWGVQLEKSTIATPFEQRPISTELALCQRYYYRITAGNTYGYIAAGVTHTTGNGAMIINFPVPLRTTPNLFGSTSASTFGLLNPAFSGLTGIAISADGTNPNNGAVTFTGSFTAGQGVIVRAANNANAYLEFGAEL
jgi:hypothetical protein